MRAISEAINDWFLAGQPIPLDTFIDWLVEAMPAPLRPCLL